MIKKMFFLSILIQIFFAFYYLQSYWEKINNGLNNPNNISELEYIVISDIIVYNNSLYATTRYNGVFISTNNGDYWVKKNKGIKEDTIFMSQLAYNNKYLFLSFKKKYFTYLDKSTGKYISDSSGYSGIYYSSDGGENWNSVSRNGLVDSNHISALTASDNLLVVGTDNDQGIYISKDNGENWVQKKIFQKGTVFSIVIKDSNIYVGSGAGLYISTDMGESWSLKLSKYIMAVHLKGDTLIAGASYSAGVYISTDKGDNWEEKNNGLREKNVMGITSLNDYIFIAINPSTVFRDPEAGVHFSSNNGEMWHTRNKGFSQTGAGKLAIKDDYIFCVIKYGLLDSTFGVYRAKLSELLNPTEVEYEILMRENFYAAPARPNPANDIVKAGIYWDAKIFDVENAEKSIYDIMGNKVGDKKELQVTNIQPYSAEIVWICSKVSSGLYFIVLNYNGQTRTIPIVVSR
ncbi:MAG: hypothetical protein N2169_06775 [bacterium]|nr:hypothetical protein [bacterium]